jgi:hypothetical protein
VPDCAEANDALDEVLRLLRRELRKRGAVAVHGNRLTDFVAAVGAAWLHGTHGIDPGEGLDAAKAAGLRPSEASAQLLGVEWDPEAREAIVVR